MSTGCFLIQLIDARAMNYRADSITENGIVDYAFDSSVMPQVYAEAGISVGNVVVDLATRRCYVNTVDKVTSAGGTDIVYDIPDNVNICGIVIGRSVNTAAPAARTPDIIHDVMNMVVFHYHPGARAIKARYPPTSPINFKSVYGCVCAFNLIAHP
jgi:hypothetical protein